MPVIASVMAAKGGTGSSTIALNLGIALQQRGRKVTIVDANTETPDLGVLLGAPHVPVTLHHVLQGQAQLHQATYTHESGTNIIPASLQTHDLTETHLQSLGHHLKQLTSDIVLLDAAPDHKHHASHPHHHANEVLVVTTADLPTVAHTRKVIKTLQQEGKSMTGVVVNRYGQVGDMHLKDIERFLEQPVIAAIPEDHHVQRAASNKEAVVHAYPDAPSTQAFQQLAMYLTGESLVPPQDPVQRPSDDSRPGNLDREIGTVAQFLNWLFGK